VTLALLLLAAQAARPDVLVVVFDDLRPQLGC
jgi:hypothetical protein